MARDAMVILISSIWESMLFKNQSVYPLDDSWIYLTVVLLKQFVFTITILLPLYPSVYSIAKGNSFLYYLLLLLLLY